MRATPPQFIRVKDYFPLDPCTERWRRWRPQRSSAHPTRAVRRQVAATNAIASHPEFPVRNMVVPPVVITLSKAVRYAQASASLFASISARSGNDVPPAAGFRYTRPIGLRWRAMLVFWKARGKILPLTYTVLN
jgi:hypothetical protein